MLTISKGTVGFPDHNLFKHDRLVISKNKIVSIIGRNGVGKTTFVKEIIKSLKNKDKKANMTGTFAYVSQINENDDFLSGGEKVKKSLVAAFKNNPDLLILDEPSANLDEMQCKWLKKKIERFNGIVLIVSHDVDLLNISAEIWAIDEEKLKVYVGNYDNYIANKNHEREKQSKAYKLQNRTIKRLEAEAVKRNQRAYRLKKGNGKKITNSEKKAAGRTSHDGMERKMQAGAKALEKRIQRMQRVEKVVTPKEIKFVEPNKNLYLRKTILNVHNKNVYIKDNLLVKNISFKLKYGEKLWVRGNNGVGKTTLVKQLLRDKFDYVSTNVNIGYFNQELQQIKKDKSIWENATENSRQNNQMIYAVLGGLDLKDFIKKASQLSGGQLVRLQLAKVLLGDNQLLILDEPTNYLDLETKSALIDFLKNYPGTVLLISHDTAFAKSVTNQELIIKNKELVRPDSLVKHANNNSGEILKLKLRLYALINDPNATINDIKEMQNKIQNMKIK